MAPVQIDQWSWTINNGMLAVYISDTPVTLKQSQGHQTTKDNADAKQGYNHAKSQRSCFKGVPEKANTETFFSERFLFQTRKYISYLPLTCVKIRNSKYL